MGQCAYCGPVPAKQYDAVASAFAKSNRSSLLNEHYERPAVLNCVGDPAGMRILDLGCGPAHIGDRLTASGATVVGVDASARLLHEAKKRNSDLTLVAADLERGLPFSRSSCFFDLALACLSLHYIKNLEVLLKSVWWNLRPGGRFICSVHHPFSGAERFGLKNYFLVQPVHDEWLVEGMPFSVSFYHYPLQTLVRMLYDSGFELEDFIEPEPDQEFWSRDPQLATQLQRQPRHLVLACRRPLSIEGGE